MIQEPLVITGARYSGSSNITADDKARFPASLPAVLAGAQQELEVGAEVPLSFTKHFQRSYSSKTC